MQAMLLQAPACFYLHATVILCREPCGTVSGTMRFGSTSKVLLVKRMLKNYRTAAPGALCCCMFSKQQTGSMSCINHL